MAYIKVQNAKRNDNGEYVGGTAAFVGSAYDASVPGGNRHRQIENLGRIVKLADDRKSGIFCSPTRGLVSFDIETEQFEQIQSSDPRVAGAPRCPAPEMHTTFGDVYLLLSFMKNHHWPEVLRDTFSERKDYERVLAHVVHAFLKDGSRIKCDTFLQQSALSHVLTDVDISTLRCDTAYFDMMGEDSTKIAFFAALCREMRRTVPNFGKGCYIDSTPLPDDIQDSVLNALRCESGKGCSVQMRLALIVDIETGLPVWFQLIPGNLMDVSTLKWISEDVCTSLDITITALVLDAGYTSRDLIETYGASKSRTMIARMPHRKGYPYKTLYHAVRDQIDRGKYDFIRNGRTYFGRRFLKKIFDVDLFTYVYVDKERALREYRTFRMNHPDDFDAMKDRDKRWCTVRGGYFVLIANRDMRPADMLDEYIGRVHIESVFKSEKSFLDLMPLAKWTDRRVEGKVLGDVIDTIIRTQMLSSLKTEKESLMDLFHDAAAVACFRNGDRLRVETPTKQARQAADKLDVVIPLSQVLATWSNGLCLD